MPLSFYRKYKDYSSSFLAAFGAASLRSSHVRRCETRDRETKTSPSGHPACGLERCQLDTCNTKKKRQSRVRIQFLAARATIISYLALLERLFLISLCSNDCFLSHCIRTIVSDETDEERTCLLGGGAGRSPDRSGYRGIEGASVDRPSLVHRPYIGRKSACKTRGHETPWTHIGSADVRIQFERNGRRKERRFANTGNYQEERGEGVKTMRCPKISRSYSWGARAFSNIQFSET